MGKWGVPRGWGLLQPLYKEGGRALPWDTHGTIHHKDERQVTTPCNRKVLHFSLLAFAGYCGKLRKTVREGLIIRRSEVRVLVGPPIKTVTYIPSRLFS